MAATDVEQSIDSAIETDSLKRTGRYIFTKRRTNYRTKNMYFFRKLLATISCRPVQLRPEAFWSAPLGNLTSGELPD